MRSFAWLALLLLTGCSRDPRVELAREKLRLDRGEIEVSVFEQKGKSRVSFEWLGENWPGDVRYREDIRGSRDSLGGTEPEISLTPEGHVLIRFTEVHRFDPAGNRYLGAPAEDDPAEKVSPVGGKP